MRRTITSTPPQPHHGAAWTGAADGLDRARVRLRWTLALLLPYALAGGVWGVIIADGATSLLQPEGAGMGALVGAALASLLWLCGAPKVALWGGLVGAAVLVLDFVAYRLSAW